MEPTCNRPGEAFNRAENIRQLPPATPARTASWGGAATPKRQRQIDNHLYLRRARSVGARRQLFDLIAHAVVQNPIARYRYRLRAPAATQMVA